MPVLLSVTRARACNRCVLRTKSSGTSSTCSARLGAWSSHADSHTAQPELQRTLNGTREAAESARLAMNRVAEMTSPNASLRGDLDAAVRDLSQAARSLREWSEMLEEKPNAIIFGTRRE